MATIEQRGYAQYRVKVRRRGVTRTKTFESLRKAQNWARIEEGRISGEDFVDRQASTLTFLRMALEKLLRYDLIVIDKLGYLPFSQPGGPLLFHLISKLYENTSLLITTNLTFADWPQVFRDATRARASASRKGSAAAPTPSAQIKLSA